MKVRKNMAKGQNSMHTIQLSDKEIWEAIV